MFMSQDRKQERAGSKDEVTVDWAKLQFIVLEIYLFDLIVALTGCFLYEVVAMCLWMYESEASSVLLPKNKQTKKKLTAYPATTSRIQLIFLSPYLLIFFNFLRKLILKSR